MSLDEDAVICDLAETYHILNYKGLPLQLVATLVCGLRDDSRIKLKMSERRLSLSETLMAATLDRLSQLLWLNTEDARKNRNRPKSVLDALEHPPEKAHKTFLSIEDFENKRAQIMRS